ncbi:hypothetical protein COOONC_15520 [Cooperia oncophora]
MNIITTVWATELSRMTTSKESKFCSEDERSGYQLLFYLNFEHPLMRCRSYNVSVGGVQHTTVTTQRRLCTTNGPLLAWLIAHLFINLGALLIRGEQIDPAYVNRHSVYCSRRLYWILQSVFDRRYTTRTMIVKDDSVFQF